jgi:hypothetical protein
VVSSNFSLAAPHELNLDPAICLFFFSSLVPLPSDHFLHLTPAITVRRNASSARFLGDPSSAPPGSRDSCGAALSHSARASAPYDLGSVLVCIPAAKTHLGAAGGGRGLQLGSPIASAEETPSSPARLNMSVFPRSVHHSHHLPRSFQSKLIPYRFVHQFSNLWMFSIFFNIRLLQQQHFMQLNIS